jgi:polysaccharide pyruvyl transferase WcaK-like protein
MQQRKRPKKRIALFGHFDSTNFGNESTLQAILYNTRRRYRDAMLLCISTGPDSTVATHHIEAIPVSPTFLKSWAPRSLPIKLLRRVCLSVLTEPYSWISGFFALRRIDMLIVPGTGLVTDAYGLLNWGPYSLFKWCLIAKMCRCKLAFMSIGAGPFHTNLGKWLTRAALALSDFRSYRDIASMESLNRIGFATGSDKVYPDLAFSLPNNLINCREPNTWSRKVVGIGVMGFSGSYSTSKIDDDGFSNYLRELTVFVTWLLKRDYDVRLLIGDRGDVSVKQELVSLLKSRLLVWDDRRILDDHVNSVEDLLTQIAATNIVVGTRFHNVLLALLYHIPVLSISFHHKCESLMRAMRMPEYCLDISGIKAETLIEKFCHLEQNADDIKLRIQESVGVFRKELDEQYGVVFNLL